MSRSRRIFDEGATRSSGTASPMLQPLKLDPFHHNYTLTALVTHIETALGEVVRDKRQCSEELSVKDEL
jgi:hypothetical protein